MPKEKIDKTIRGLKDFQLKSVDYVYDQLYNKGQDKMLIADEVGLGKTIVAKGIIAKAYEQYMANGGPTKVNRTFNIVYICSNQALAAQNIAKLNFLEDNIYIDKTVNRLAYLAFEKVVKPPSFLINALTPATSFESGSSMGEAKERAILYCLLSNFTAFKNNDSIKLLLKGKIAKMETWDCRINEVLNNAQEKIKKDLYSKFRNELIIYEVNAVSMPRLFKNLGGKPNLYLWRALQKYCDSNHNDIQISSEIIKHLRKILSKLCLQYLEADIFILDEFQRYSNLIKLDEDAENQAIEIARTVFSIPNAKVLMLSATPFKPYTNDFDEINGEVHHKEFDDVLKFLNVNNEQINNWENYTNERNQFFKLLRQPKHLLRNYDEALDLKRKLESFYKVVMIRTERLLASEDNNALVQDVYDKRFKNREKGLIELSHEDVEDFVSIDQVTMHLNQEHKARLPVPIEYVKSSPFAFSFLHGYQHSNKLQQYLAGDEVLEKLLKKTKNAWVNYKNIDNYKPIIATNITNFPNAKLRSLLDETVVNGGWKYLWIPPTVEYYKPEGAYSKSKGFSKTLIFSSWMLVPRMIASLVSYEVERESIGKLELANSEEKIKYFKRAKEEKRKPAPQFTYVKISEDEDPKRMNNMGYLYPCYSLANYFITSNVISEQKTVKQIREIVKDKIRVKLQRLINNHSNSDHLKNYQIWYWAAPLLLDKESDREKLIREWLSDGLPNSDSSIDAEDDKPNQKENSGKQQQFKTMYELFNNSKDFNLPMISGQHFEDLLDYMVSLACGSPAICFLRNTAKEIELRKESLSAAFHIASSFVTLFNKPESIAAIRRTTYSKEYLDKVLEYSIDGNIQSMIDEYIYLLKDTENIHNEMDLANHISDILSVRTSNIQVDDLQTFLNNAKSEGKKETKTLRTHYAMEFGNQKMVTKSGSKQINVRQAFNSPFRPFVLASTSIGQEGLDFHLYCKKIFHWNLPSNPIDFEQREGRINRYKGLVIRQNIAAKYSKNIIEADCANIWNRIFELAGSEKEFNKSKSDLVPFWHTESIDNIKIERFVPLYPFSKDIEKYKNLMKVLTYYRLTFGQPRQDELIDVMAEYGSDVELKSKLSSLLINLSPLNFTVK